MSELYEENGHYLCKVYQQFLHQVEDFQVRDSDVFVASFPKSGTTWTQEMVWLLLNDLDYKGAEKPLDIRSPYLEGFAYASLIPAKQNPSQHDLYLRQLIKQSLEEAKTLADPRVFKLHLPWPFFPREIREKRKKAKIIYVNRNPKDTCISQNKHVSIFLPTPINTTCEEFLNDKIWYGPYWRHVLTFWNMRDEPNLLFLRYEDMKRDLPSVIKKVSNFLGKRYDDEQLGKLAEHLSFENMKNNDAVNKKDTMRAFGVQPENCNFIRKGIVGSHKTEMPVEYIRRFDEWIKQHFEGTALLYD